jgi:tetratricopeptide (TPR) repeat protein
MATAVFDSETCVRFRTTHGAIAVRNLQAQIEGQLQAMGGRIELSRCPSLIEMFLLRGNLLGRISDYELAAALAEQLVYDAAENGDAFFARARTRATFHRFKDALDDLDSAVRFGTEHIAADGERAAIFQAIGHYDEALAIRRNAAECRAGFETLGALAGLYAERGEISAAERLFDESRDRYRGVSPFPLALLDFQRGHMWMAEDDFHRARTWFDAARRRLPAYASAQGHLAEVEAAVGEIDAAITLLRPLTTSSDDPDYAAQLARILEAAGRAKESCAWRVLAAERYDELVLHHPEAFVDHAAEFWLEAGADPHKALQLARRNLAVRQTPRAYELLSRATAAV